MIDFVFGYFGMFIRWIFVYKCNTKEMQRVYQEKLKDEEVKDNLAGLLLLPIVFIIGIIIYFVEKK